MAGTEGDPGLQPERTRLSWERTSVGFLAVGALVLLRHGELPFAGRLVVAAIAGGTALAVLAIGRQRAEDEGAAPVAVAALGIFTATLALAVTALILVARP